jgi:hypothetical protein
VLRFCRFVAGPKFAWYLLFTFLTVLFFCM